MTAARILNRARGLGFQIEARDDGRLSVRPAARLTPDLAADLHRHKSEILNLLNPCRGWQTVPPADLPLVMLRPSPTLCRRELVIAYMLRQCASRGLREWLIHRKAAYTEMTATTWDGKLLTYAAARDAACWQLNRAEAAVWALLEGIESCIENLGSDRRCKVETPPFAPPANSRLSNGHSLG